MVMGRIPCVLMRGGTSKGVFFKKEDIPPEGPARDSVILKIFGSGDPMQVDGLGGTHTHTSKAMVVWRSDRADIDLEYTFGQVGIERAFIDYAGNCGNLTSAVGPFGIDEGIVRVKEPYTVVKMYNTNTKKRVEARVPVEDSSTKYEGDYRIDGVPNTGARIDVKWHKPGGAFSGKLLPTGEPADKIDTGVETVTASIIDASNPAVFVRAKDVGLTGRELPGEVDGASLMRLERIRGKAAEMMGLVKDSEEATEKSPHFPFIVLVGEKQDYRTISGRVHRKDEYHVLARLFSMQKMHHAYAVTGAICTGAAAKTPKSIVNQLCDADSDKVMIGHPKGLIDVDVKTRPAGESVEIESVTVGRTARRLMAGITYFIS